MGCAVAGRRGGPDLVGLTVLTVLSKEPRHAYYLHRFIIDTNKNYVTGLPRSLYHAVDRLTRDGFIAPVETTRDGRRPERTVYEITDLGRAEMSERLRSLLANIGRDSTPFVAALSLMGSLPVEEVEQALRARSAALRESIEAAERTAAELAEAGLPRLPLLKIEYEHARDVTELEWVEALVKELHKGRIDWEVPLPPTAR